VGGFILYNIRFIIENPRTVETVAVGNDNEKQDSNESENHGPGAGNGESEVEIKSAGFVCHVLYLRKKVQNRKGNRMIPLSVLCNLF
jgi:hypothetical protein